MYHFIFDGIFYLFSETIIDMLSTQFVTALQTPHQTYEYLHMASATNVNKIT